MTKYIPLTPLENLKGFATSRPPIIVFIVCLGLVGLVLMTLALYIKDGELKTSEITEDWNGFLESFSDVEFCIQNGSFPPVVSSAASPITTSPLAQATASTPSDVLRNYSISMLLAIQPTPEFVSIPHNLTMVSGYISGADLGLKGRAASERITVAAQLPFNWNSSQCSFSSSSMILNSCALVHIYTCVMFQAPEHVFPPSRSPAICEIMNSTGVEYHANIKGHNARAYPTRPCRSKPILHIKYKLDPTLTVLLTLSDRSLINLHLLHTSYFLFVMTITVLLYAMVRGRPMKLKLSSAMSLPLTSTTDI